MFIAQRVINGRRQLTSPPALREFINCGVSLGALLLVKCAIVVSFHVVNPLVRKPVENALLYLQALLQREVSVVRRTLDIMTVIMLCNEVILGGGLKLFASATRRLSRSKPHINQGS
jgi:uncharacterized membrane protein YczE